MKKPPHKEAAELNPSPLDLLPQQLLIQQVLGALVIRLSYAHFILELNLCSLLGIDAEKGRVLTEDLPLSKLASRFLRTVKEKTPQPEILKQFKKILKDLEGINEKRNRLVHGFWTFPDDGPPLLVPKKGPITSVKAPALNEISDLVNATDLFTQEFFKCMNRINNPHMYAQRLPSHRAP